MINQCGVYLLKKDPDKSGKEQITQINMSGQDKEEITKDAA